MGHGMVPPPTSSRLKSRKGCKVFKALFDDILMNSWFDKFSGQVALVSNERSEMTLKKEKG